MGIQTRYDLDRARGRIGAEVDAEVMPGIGAEAELPFTDLK